MKKIPAVLLLVAYLGFIVSVFVNTHHDLHVYVCDKSGDNLLTDVSSETNENCCSYSLMSQKLKLNAQQATPFYKLIIPCHFIALCSNFITALFQEPKEVYTAYSAPIIYPSLYLKNRVLLI